MVSKCVSRTLVLCLTTMATALCGCDAATIARLRTLFPGIPAPAGSGDITVERIVKTDPPNTTTDVLFPLTSTPVDGLGFRWDLEDDGHVTDGGNTDFPDAFDKIMEMEMFVEGFFEHEFEPATLAAKIEDGHEYVIGPIDQEGGLRITRKVFISPTHGFARWLDIFENTGDSDLTVESENRGNLGSDESNNNVFASSNGNTTLEEGDIWWINGQQFAADPTIACFFTGTKDTEKTQDSVVLDYGKHQVVAAHSRNIMASFWFQRTPDRSSSTSLLAQENQVVADLLALMHSLETFPVVDSAYLEGMTAAEVNDLHKAGGNVGVSGEAGAVAAGATVTVTNTTNGSERSGTAGSDGSFGPLNVKGSAGDTIQVSDGSQEWTKTVP